MGICSRQEPEEVFVCDEPFRRTVCGNDRFWRRRAQLNTALATFFNWDWANRTATCAVCSKCAYVHWFMRD